MDQSARRRQRPQISRPTHEHQRFGKRLRDLRKRKGLSQAQLDRELSQRHTSGLSHTNISHLERRSHMPRQDMLKLPAAFFGVPVMYFMQDDNVVIRERRKANIEARLASLADGGCAGKPLYDEPIPERDLTSRVEALAGTIRHAGRLKGQRHELDREPHHIRSGAGASHRLFVFYPSA